ncbi:MAG: archaetidylserine decarboxylase [Arsenophonus sp.]|nr:MAG: archaetidylserine decarboxylase [Arsenophonus sp.]
MKEKISFFVQKKITQFFGWIANKNCSFLTKIFIKFFVKKYKINLQENRLNHYSQYKNINSFFLRKLKKKNRPIASGYNQLVSPVDGIITELGKIQKNIIIQAKKYNYTLESLFANDINSSILFKNGLFITFYLSPANYHRVHMPYSGILKKMIYIPGTFFSVNKKNVNSISNIFTKNERIICIFNTKFGMMAQILIGSIIVGSISTKWHGIINKKHENEIQYWNYSKNNKIFLKKGEEMGKFQIGSTVITLFQKKYITLNSSLKKKMFIKFGSEIGNVSDLKKTN